MVNYLLDTTILIDLLRQRSDVWDFLEKHPEDKFLTSCICEAEVWEGVYREKEADFAKRKRVLQGFLESLFEIIPFDSEQAQIAGQIRSTLPTKGEMTGDLDVLIAAGALASNAILLTKNVKHFTRIKNLRIQTV